MELEPKDKADLIRIIPPMEYMRVDWDGRVNWLEQKLHRLWLEAAMNYLKLLGTIGIFTLLCLVIGAATYFLGTNPSRVQDGFLMMEVGGLVWIVCAVLLFPPWLAIHYGIVKAPELRKRLNEAKKDRDRHNLGFIAQDVGHYPEGIIDHTP